MGRYNMAMFGNIKSIQVEVNSSLIDAIEILKNYCDKSSDSYKSLMSIEVGSHKKVIVSDNLFLIEQVYMTKDREECFYESHRQYIDIHLIVEGSETIEVENIDNLTTTQDYIAQKDALKYSYETEGSVLKLQRGEIAIFYPYDGHMTCLTQNGISKVVKVVAKVLINE